MELADRLLVQEGFIGPDIGRGYKLDWADRFIVHITDRGKVGLAGDKPVFFEMMQPANVPEDMTLELPEDSGQRKGRSSVGEEIGHCLSGEAFGVKAFGEYAAVVSAPVQTADLVFGELDGLVEQEGPFVVR